VGCRAPVRAAEQAAEKLTNSERSLRIDIAGASTSDLYNFFDSLPYLKLPPESMNFEKNEFFRSL
jgi:hypothetical protein